MDVCVYAHARAYGFSKGQELHNSFNTLLNRLQNENCFFLHHLKIGMLPYTQLHVLYRHFPEGCGRGGHLTCRIILYLAKYDRLHNCHADWT